jgi:hypothetical protein
MSIPPLQPQPSTLSAVAGRDRLLDFVLAGAGTADSEQARQGYTPTSFALIVFVIGFGFLTALYAALLFFRDANAVGWVQEFFQGGMRYRGPFTYFAPTIGDGFLLPLAAGVTILGYHAVAALLETAAVPQNVRSDLAVALSRIRPTTAPFLAITSSVVVNAVWTLNPSTIPNWTIRPGRLYFPGWYHAAFFAVIMWWFLAFGQRMYVVSAWVFSTFRKYATSDDVALVESRDSVSDAAMRVWEGIAAVITLLFGFTILMYVDNYGHGWSREALGSSVTTAALLAMTAAVLIAVPLIWGWNFILPASRWSASLRRRGGAIRTWLPALNVVLIGMTLWKLTVILPSLHDWWFAAAIAGVLLPVMVFEECVADIYWVEGVTLTGTGVTSAAAAAFIVCAGIEVGLGTALKAVEPLVLGALARPFMSSLLTSFTAFVLAAAIICLTWLSSDPDSRASGPRATPHPAIFDVVKNLGQYWALYQLVLIPIALLVYQIQGAIVLNSDTSDMVSLLWAFSGAIGVGVMFPVRNNYDHLRMLEADTANHPTFDQVSNHIQFQVGATLVFAVPLILWMWLSALAILVTAKPS